MASNQVMHKCKSCGKSTLHVQPSTSHLLHLVMSVLTFGFWIIVWSWVAISNSTQAQCTVCGKTKGAFG